MYSTNHCIATSEAVEQPKEWLVLVFEAIRLLKMLLPHHSNSDLSGTYMYFLTSLISIALIGDRDAAGFHIFIFACRVDSSPVGNCSTHLRTWKSFIHGLIDLKLSRFMSTDSWL